MLLPLGMPYAGRLKCHTPDVLEDDQDRCNDPDIVLGAKQNPAIIGVQNVVGVSKKIMKLDVIIGRNFGEDDVHRR
jgi:hypothetical protein